MLLGSPKDFLSKCDAFQKLVVHTFEVTINVPSAHSGASLNRTGYIRKYSVRVASDQTDRTDHQNENNGQHNRVLGDVLALIVPPQLKRICHVRASVPRPDSTAEKM
jgi:hypothetical protein